MNGGAPQRHGAKFDQSETHSMPSQAGTPKPAMLLELTFQLPVLRRAHTGLHTTTTERQIGGYTSIPLGRDPDRVNFANSLSRPDPTFHPLSAVSPCVLSVEKAQRR